MTENQLRYLTLQETKRHNEATEALTSSDLSERARANLAKETETHRSNTVNEGLDERRVAKDEDYTAHRKRVETWETVFKGLDTARKVGDTVLDFIDAFKSKGSTKSSSSTKKE